MRRLAVALIVLILFLAIDVVVALVIEPDAQSPQEAVQKLGIEIVARSLVIGMKWRLDLPQKVDELTYLEDIGAEKNVVIYTLSINTDGGEFDRMMTDIHDHVQDAACSREDYRKLLTYGLAVAIRYRSSGGREAMPVLITRETCGWR